MLLNQNVANPHGYYGAVYDFNCAQQRGQWQYLYRAVDRDGDTIDFLLRAKRDCAAARRFLERAIDLHGVPEKITIDKSGANMAAIQSVKADSGADIEMRQIKYSTTSSSRTTGPSSASCSR